MTRRIVPVDERQRYPAKPNSKFPPAPPDINKEARDWYEGIARMPHTVAWRSPEWIDLRRMARVVEFTNNNEPRASLLTEIRRFEQRAGVTAADRAALGIVWDE